MKPLLALALLAVTACLVTEQVDFAERNSPPRVEIVSPNAFTRLPAGGDLRCPGPGMQLRLVARVSDLDVEQKVETRVFVNRALKRNLEIPPSAARTPERSDVVVCLDYELFNRPCNYVELVVTSEFAFLNDFDWYATATKGDVGSVYWFVLGDASGTAADATPADCGSILADGGLP